MPKFIDELKHFDPELHKVASSLVDLAFAPGALDGKTKTLIVLALDALVGAKKGVEILAKQARKLGATDQEIAEAIRLAYFVAGNGVLVVAEEAFDYDDDDDDDDDDYDDEDEDEDEDKQDEQDDENIEEENHNFETTPESKQGEMDSEEDEYEIQEFPGIVE